MLAAVIARTFSPLMLFFRSTMQKIVERNNRNSSDGNTNFVMLRERSKVVSLLSTMAAIGAENVLTMTTELVEKRIQRLMP